MDAIERHLILVVILSVATGVLYSLVVFTVNPCILKNNDRTMLVLLSMMFSMPAALSVLVLGGTIKALDLPHPKEA